MGKSHKKFITFSTLGMACLILIGAFQNCSWKLRDLPAGKEQPTVDPVITVEQTSLRLLLTRCYSCHAAGRNDGGFGYVDDLERMLTTGMIVAGQPSQARVYQEISANEMPPGNPFSADEKQAIYDWILSLGTDLMAPGFQTIKTEILSPKCVSCHNRSHSSYSHHQVSYSNYSDTMKTVTPGNPSMSLLFEVVSRTRHPRTMSNPGPFPSEADAGLVRRWIESGAQEGSP